MDGQNAVDAQGVIWYQGETDDKKTKMYGKLFICISDIGNTYDIHPKVKKPADYGYFAQNNELA